jgi:hypothetical protein
MSVSEDPDARSRWDALLDGLLLERAVLLEDVGERIRAEVPVYRTVPAEQLQAGFAVELERILVSARGHRQAVSDRELADLAAVGEARASQGVAADDMLLAWRLGVQVVLEHARRVGQRIGVEPTDMLEFVQSLIAWSDRAMVITASAHRRAEFELARQQQEERGELVRGALLGTLAPNALREQAQALALDVTAEYVTVRAELPTGTARSELERSLGFHETVHPRRGLMTTLAGDLVGFSRDLRAADTTAAVAVGPRRPLEHLAESFQLATRALETMRAFELTGVTTLDDLGLLPAIVADAAVGDALVRRHIEPLTGPGASEIQASLLVYFDCQMHVERAAERLFVHPNTLRYRLARYEEFTGTNLRDPLTAFEVWWALRRATIHRPAAAGASSA